MTLVSEDWLNQGFRTLLVANGSFAQGSGTAFRKLTLSRSVCREPPWAQSSPPWPLRCSCPGEVVAIEAQMVWGSINDSLVVPEFSFVEGMFWLDSRIYHSYCNWFHSKGPLAQDSDKASGAVPIEETGCWKPGKKLYVCGIESRSFDVWRTLLELVSQLRMAFDKTFITGDCTRSGTSAE